MVFAILTGIVCLFLGFELLISYLEEFNIHSAKRMDERTKMMKGNSKYDELNMVIRKKTTNRLEMHDRRIRNLRKSPISPQKKFI